LFAFSDLAHMASRANILFLTSPQDILIF